MTSNRVRVGAFDARDRATKRRRRARTKEGRTYVGSISWSVDYVSGLGFDEIEQLDLKQVLRETAHVDAPPELRLAKLGLACALAGDVSSGPRAWSATSRLFDAATRLNGDDPEVFLLRGNAAADIGSRCERGAQALFREAVRSFEKAVALSPENGRYRHQLGWAMYHGHVRAVEEALEQFDRAIELDQRAASSAPTGIEWSILYRAHCLHDLGRWREAEQAFGLIPSHVLLQRGAWLREKTLEQRAWCLLQAGDRDSALELFEEVLVHYEAKPDLAYATSVPYLSKAVDTFPSLAQRVLHVKAAAEREARASQTSA